MAEPISAGLALAIGSAVGGTGLSAASLFGAFGGPRRAPTVDISAELARINALFERERQAIEAASGRLFGIQTSQLRERQAAAGTFTSPVREAALGRLAEGQQAALQQALGQSFGRQAQTEASLLSQLAQLRAGQQAQAEQLAAQRRAGIAGLGAGLLSFGAQRFARGLGSDRGGLLRQRTATEPSMFSGLLTQTSPFQAGVAPTLPAGLRQFNPLPGFPSPTPRGGFNIGPSLNIPGFGFGRQF